MARSEGGLGMGMFNPSYYTYKTERYSFVGSPQQRDGITTTKDQRFINFYPELISTDITGGKKYYIKKRPGELLQHDFTVTAQGRGVYVWNNNIFVILGNTVYRNNASLITLTTSTGLCGITLYNGVTNYLVILDGIQGWIVSDAGVATQITNASFPSPHIPTPVYIDGYLVVAQANSNLIWNSKVNDPLTWDPSFFVAKELYPDNIVGIVRSQNYILVFGQKSLEFFYDNANATGSPFQTNPSAVLKMGAASTFGIVQTEKETVFVGDTDNGGYTVWLVDGFNAKQIGIEPVLQALDDEGTDISNCSAFSIHSAGHKFYVLNLNTSNRTFVYDFEEKMWHEWQYNGTIFNCRRAADGNDGYPILVDYTQGKTYYLKAEQYTDNGVTITCTATTVKIDFEDNNRKFWYRFSLIGDSPAGATVVPIQLYWSDDDYTTWQPPSPGRTLNFNGVFTATYQLGQSRRRAWQIVYDQPDELRLEGFEIDINMGTR